MAHTFARPLAVGYAALLALVVYRVDSVPRPPEPYGGYTWETAVDEVRFEIEATVTGLRRAVLEAEATYTTSRERIERLRDTLAAPPDSP